MLPKILNEEPRVFENVKTYVFDQPTDAAVAVAGEIAELIRLKASKGEKCILGLATGSTPKPLYAELVRLHKEEGLSFKNVISFNLDEYYPMKPEALQSYVRFMKEQLFDHVDIPTGQYNVPDGTLAQDQIAAYCADYEARIEALGGIDFQVLGIGGNGHIGFNESGSSIYSKTRLVALDAITRINAANDFFGLEKTARKAITLGVQKIMEAKRVVLMAWGEKKASIVKESVEGVVTSQVPASYLQNHPNTAFVLDKPASIELTRFKEPWLVEQVEWDANLIRKAVVSLAKKVDKPILALTDKEYNENGLNDLIALAKNGSAYNVNIDVFNQLKRTITGWPGGRPNVDDTFRPERAEPAQKRVLIFSPHPDDDIISMGGTFIRLNDQGHDVHVAYQTSGNIAVADDEALRFADFVQDFNSKFDLGDNGGGAAKIFNESRSALNQKKDGIDTPELRAIKGLMRRGEAKATCRFVGIPDENAHFLDLPFYETGKIEKNPIGDEDIQIIVDKIKEIKPHQIYAAGDLADPHGTHKVCLDAIFAALEILKDEPFMQDCWVWLYKGAWAEWDIDQIEMAVPMSPEEMLKKRFGIFKHQSQKDGVVFQGSDSREFWQRAEERNTETATIFNNLGFVEYTAMEAFKRYHFIDKSLNNF